MSAFEIVLADNRRIYCVDPQTLDQVQDVPPELLGKANSYETCIGQPEGLAYVLLTDSDVQLLGNFSSPVSLVMTNDDGTSHAFPLLYFIRAFSCTWAGSTDSVYLCELADSRWFLNRMTVCDASYNVLTPVAYDYDQAETRAYYAYSLRGTSLWTWSGIVSDLVAKIPAGLAAITPGLPSVPSSIPKNFHFSGTNAWEALHLVLAEIGCTTRRNPTTGLISIIDMGVDQTSHNAPVAAAGPPAAALAPYTSGPAHFPEKVRVYFQNQTNQPGLEGTITRGVESWFLGPETYFDIATNTIHADIATLPGTIHPIHARESAVFASAPIEFGSSIPINFAALQTRANELAADFLSSRYWGIYARTDYVGCHDIPLGSEVRKIVWYDLGAGLKTRLHRSFEPALPSSLQRNGGGGYSELQLSQAKISSPPTLGLSASVQGDGFSRESPRPQLSWLVTDQVLYVPYPLTKVDSTSSLSQPVLGKTYPDNADCAVTNLLGLTMNVPPTVTIPDDPVLPTNYYIGRLIGTILHVDEGGTRQLPLFGIVSEGGGFVVGKALGAILKNTLGIIRVWNGPLGSEVDTGINLYAYNKYADVDSGHWIASHHNGYGWYLIAAECT